MLDAQGVEVTREAMGSIPDEVLAGNADPSAGHVHIRSFFREPSHPLELEIGSGKGTFILDAARAKPDTNFLGIEWAGEFFRYAADRVRRAGVSNVRMYCGDAVEFIRWRCPSGVFRVIHLYFSDPWPKRKHWKNRVVQDRFLFDAHRVLCAHGEVRIVTDHEEYWAWMEEHFARWTAEGAPGFAGPGAPFERSEFERAGSAADGELVGSNFERKYMLEGRPFHSAVLRKRGEQ